MDAFSDLQVPGGYSSLSRFDHRDEEAGNGHICGWEKSFIIYKEKVVVNRGREKEEEEESL